LHKFLEKYIMAKNRQYIRNKGGNPGYRGGDQVDGQGNAPLNDGDDETLVDIVEVKEQAQDFFEKNQSLVLGLLVAAVLLVGGYLAYKYGYQAPKEKAGMEAIHKAQYQFQQDSFALALTNPGEGYEGFLDIIDNYSGTKAANISKYYAGVSYLNLGNYDVAIEYLKDYNANDDITPITKYGVMGDAYAESGDLESAKANYLKATNGDNDFLTPYYLNKLAVLNMNQGDNAGALKLYQRIKAEYPQASEARDADKYIGMLKAS